MNLLFLPGYACTSRIWLPLRARLESDHSITLVDWPCADTSHFHVLADFTGWMRAWAGSARFDCVVGHSMGGLVALDWLRSEAGAAQRVVLMESFLLPPAPFFRNVLLNEASPEAASVHAMLQCERERYSPWLQEDLRCVDMTRCLLGSGARVDALYGDRGCGSAERVAAELAWPEAVAGRVRLGIVPQACHFPMLEKPDATATALSTILSQ